MFELLSVGVVLAALVALMIAAAVVVALVKLGLGLLILPFELLGGLVGGGLEVLLGVGVVAAVVLLLLGALLLTVVPVVAGLLLSLLVPAALVIGLILLLANSRTVPAP